MSDKNRRTWFRFHLSTCLVLMLVGGGLLGLNFIPDLGWCFPGLDIDGGWIGTESVYYGWPWWCYSVVVESATGRVSGTSWLMGWIIVVADVVVAMLILLAVAVGCEYRARRQ